VAALAPLAADPKRGPLPHAYLAGDYIGVTKMQARLGQVKDAVASAAKARSILERLSAVSPTNETLREGLAASYEASADVFQGDGCLTRSMRFLRQMHAIDRQLVAADPNNRMAVPTSHGAT
jgi:hypothetical protein